MDYSVDKKDFDSFLFESFEGSECYHRELRLSAEEIEYLRNKYPSATIVKLPGQEPLDKQWYDIEIPTT